MTIEIVEKKELEECLSAIKNALSKIRWRLSSYARRRLLIDIAALCTRLRSAVLVDYGGRMPVLQEQLCLLLHSTQKESLLLNSLKVVVIEDMLFLVHVNGAIEDMQLSLHMQVPLQFIILDQGPPKFSSCKDNSAIIEQFKAIQKQFSSTQFSLQQLETKEENDSDCSQLKSEAKGIPDLSLYVKGYDVSPPTLNGWLLGYPVIYLFDRENANQAAKNLSTGQLQIFRILVSCLNHSSNRMLYFFSDGNLFEKALEEDELMSFTVPIDLSKSGKDEPWAEAFFSHILEKWHLHKHIWNNMKFEVVQFPFQSIAL